MLLALLMACTTDVSVSKANEDTETLSAQERLGLTDGEVARILDFLNTCLTSFALLDEDVGLDSDAAASLISHRDGPDESCSTGDDAPYLTLDEVDAVPQVGDQTILAILAWLVDGDLDPGGTWDGVYFTDEEVALVLEVANYATPEQLDIDVGLDADTVDELLDARPIPDMDALAAVPEVGPSALEKLKDYATAGGA
ncbi:MAG: hypothetical protein Q8P18_00370 [Pseudomonadota bacterium]|nr:hypothetical protein [Pseudomonadota bacterium]